MISKTEAEIIAHEYIDGIILDQQVDTIIKMSSKYPKAWVFDIYHRNHDKDTFHSIIEVTNLGVVSDWRKIHISEETGE